jgi:hypothetical protein
MLPLPRPARALLRWRSDAGADSSLESIRADRAAAVERELEVLERTGEMGPHLAAAAELSRTLHQWALEHRRALLAQAQRDRHAADAVRPLLVDALAELEFRLDSAHKAPLPPTTIRALQAERDELLVQLNTLPQEAQAAS